MSVESITRKALNVGRGVHQGVVSEVGFTTKISHFERKTDWRLVNVTNEVPAFKVEFTDGSTKILQASEESEVSVGGTVEFGERMALWSKNE